MTMSKDDLLPLVATALADNLGASTQEIADAAGIGRTTLHRHFPTRRALTSEVAQHALHESDRVMTACGFDDLPAEEAVEHLASEVLTLAVAYALIWAEPPITDRADLQQEAAARDDRFERFAARAQAEGVFRADVPSRWIVYSLGSQALGLWYAVRTGVVAPRDASRLFRTTVLEGLGRDSAARE